MLFYTLTNLQGSQTHWRHTCVFLPFYTLTNLPGSQTSIALLNTNGMFYTLTNLQGSQTARKVQKRKYSFTLLQTYKVLKLTCK